MKTVPLPIGKGGVYKNVHDVALRDNDAELVDGYIDELGNAVKRPGLSLFKDIGAGEYIVGMYWWSEQECVIAVTSHNAYKVEYDTGSGTVTLTTLGSGASQIFDEPRVTFANDGSNVLIAGGKNIYHSDGDASSLTQMADGDAPDYVSHVEYLDTYIIANFIGTNGTFVKNRFYWSDLGDLSDWTATSFASAEGDPDHIQAIIVHNREIFLLGTDTCEFWENDGINPFSRVPGGFIEKGCGARHSVVYDESGLYWLADDRHFVRWSGGQITRFSTPYDTEIQSFSAVSDCLGDRIEIMGQPFLLFSFPSANKTLCCNLSTDPPKWSEWGHWQSQSSTYNRFIGNAHCFCPAWGIHLVGSRLDSKIYELSPDYYDDADDEIRFKLETGHIDHGTAQNKMSQALRMRVRRGEVDLQAAALMVRWKDENKAWSNSHQLSLLGYQGERGLLARMRRLGYYSARKWEITCTDAVPLTIAYPEEDMELWV